MPRGIGYKITKRVKKKARGRKGFGLNNRHG